MNNYVIQNIYVEQKGKAARMKGIRHERSREK
jgi:hypothetical protein